MLKTMKTLSIGLLLAAAMVGHAEEQRDYYGEPGLNAFKQTVGHTSIESIDPFSGIVQLQQTDLVVPGNGGLDITIHRSYTTPQDDMGMDWFNVMGSGWVMHYGRVVVPVTYILSMCPSGFDGPNFETVRDNPSFEKPDGGRELLISDTSDLSNRGVYKTKSNWKAECIQDRPGLKVTSPNGTVYWMDKEARVFNPGADAQEVSWFTSKVEDTSGNTLDISYVEFASQMQYIKEINANDGRKVVFEYVDVADIENQAPANELTRNAVVSSISSEGQTWSYSYTPILEGTYSDGSAYRLLALTTVTPPEGGVWAYGYQIHEGPVEEYTRKALLLDMVTYPYGGVVNYDYQAKDFYQEYGKNDLRKWVISQKHISGPNVTAGTWSYAFEPGSVAYSNFPGGADKATITRPDGSREELLHFGYKTVNSGDVWRVGLLINKRIWNAENQSVQFENYNWGKRAIATENNTYSKLSGDWKLDNDVYAAYMTGTWVSIDGVSGSGFTTTYANHDEFGNPQQIIEMASKYYADEVEQPGGVNRTINMTYQNDTGRWIIGLPLTEEIEGIGTVIKTYTAAGKLETENKYGVQTEYRYHPNGDLHQVIDAKGNTTIYTDYKRGQAQTIQYPESISISRVMSNRGTLTSETNGRGFTKTYQWDDLNRLKNIAFPKGSPVDISWEAGSSILIRGNYREEKFYDGFGQVYQVKRKDLLTGEEIITRTGYDAEGRVEFKGMPYKAGEIEKGVTYQFDAMGRVKRETYEDGTYTSMEYPNVYTEMVTDALGRKMKQIYRFYGSPNNDRTLLQMEQVKPAPEEGDVVVQMHKNKLNQTTQILQAHYLAQQAGYWGYSRIFNFNAKTQLENETHPEYNPISYTYDAVGNMETKTYEGLPGITYGYDGLNRLRTITFADGQPGYFMDYNDNNNLESVSNDNTSRGFIYDSNDNLEHELVVIHGKNYPISYGYNASDFIETVTYPSGRVVTFAPDAFGRATKASPYVTTVNSESNGNIKDFEFANGAVHHFTYTDRGWLDNLIVDDLVHLDYGYDAVGNIKTIGDLITPANNRSMNYDDKNRLKDATGSWGAATYSYDGIGNIRGKAIGSNVVDSYQYLDGKNRLNKIERLNAYFDQTTYSYNEKGEMLSKANRRTALPIAFNDVYEYGYDNQGNLKTVKKSQYSGLDVISTENFLFTYDAQNNRVQRVAKGKTKQYLFSNNGLLLGEYHVAPELGNALFGKEHVYLQGKKVASIKINTPPIVSAGVDKQVTELTSVSLSGSASDLDGTLSTYQWTQISGPAVTLNNASTKTATFTAPDITTQTSATFRFTARDNNGDSASDDVLVTFNVQIITNNPPVVVNDSAVANGEVALRLYVLANDSDPDGDAIYISAVGQPQGGTVTNNSSYLSYYPNSSFSGLDTFTYTVSDRKGGLTVGTITVTATLNLLPNAVDDVGDVWSDYNGYVIVLNNDTDPDGDKLNVDSVTDAKHGLAFDPNTSGANYVHYSSYEGYIGPDSFTYTVRDYDPVTGGQKNGTDTAVVNVNVIKSEAKKPVDDHFYANRKDTVYFNVLDNDIDPSNSGLEINPSLTYLSFPGSLTVERKLIKFVPNPNSTSARATFSYTIPYSGQGQVTVYFDNSNISPQPKGDYAYTEVDQSVVIDVLKNDIDPNGQSLSISAFSQGSKGGVISLLGNSLVYQPKPGFAESEIFSYDIKDSGGLGNRGWVTVTVGQRNVSIPIASNDGVTTNDLTDIDINVLANDVDADGHPIHISSYTSPVSGKIIKIGNNFRYTPKAFFTGTDSFQYVCSDGKGGEMTATVTINVTLAQRPPVANPDYINTAVNTAVAIYPVANDTDINGDTLSLTYYSVPAHGTLAKKGAKLQYTPARDYIGSDSFSYTVSDGKGGSASGIVYINVTAPNNAPVAVNDSVSTNLNTATTINVLANDRDADAQTLQVVSFTQGTYGAVAQSGNQLIYTPNNGYVGTDVFTYTITDGIVNATAQVTVSVVDPDAPVLPTTTITKIKTTAKGITYYDITLSSSKPGVTYFEFASGGTILASSGGSYYTGSGFQVYSGIVKIQMNKGATSTFKYYTIGSDGTVEAVKQEAL